MNQPSTGTIVRIAGPVVVARGLADVHIYDVIYVGQMRLVGEVIRLAGDLATIQVYEDTGGLRVGEPVASSGGPFVVELGPGLLGAIYDGVQRPLPVLREQQGDFITRGGTALALDRQGKHNQAVRLLKVALAIRDSSGLRFLLAQSNESAGRFRHAIVHLQAVAKMKPDVAWYPNKIGRLHLKEGRTDLACEAFRRSLKIKPDYAVARANVKKYCGG